jgi:hypothetical protein
VGSPGFQKADPKGFAPAGVNLKAVVDLALDVLDDESGFCVKVGDGVEVDSNSDLLILILGVGERRTARPAFPRLP